MDTTNDILIACRSLFSPGQVAELRILEIPGTRGFKFNAAGWFNDWDALAATAAAYNARNPAGIYVTLNSLHRACLARTENKVIERIKDTSSDRDVVRRQWLPIDLDPERPSGVSSTNEELLAARKVMEQVATWLETELHFPTGLKAHSGNGVHLLYRIDLPSDEDSRLLVGSCLRAIAEHFPFATTHVKVDTGVFNAARIWKLWGTVARKGSHTTDRPHRQSRLWTPTQFTQLTPTPLEQLQKLSAIAQPFARASGKPATRSSKPASKKGTSSEHWFDLDAWMVRNHVEVARTEPFDGTGTRHILTHCLFDSSHVRTSAILGRAPSGAIFYKCQHESCVQNGWKEAKALFYGNGETTQPGVEETTQESPWALAGTFIDENYTGDDFGRITLRRHRETYYAYNTRLHTYQPMSVDKMKVHITRWLGESGYRSGTRTVVDVLNSVGSMVTVPEELQMPLRTSIDPETRCATADPQLRNWITLQNGILDVDAILSGEVMSACLQNHTTEWLSTTTLPFAFPDNELAAQCSLWLQILDELLEGDAERIAVIQEMFGYCFWPGTELEKFFILHGRGNNGKSTILDVLTMLLGYPNVTNLSLDQLADATLRYELYQKAANICGDLPEMDSVDEGLIKRIVTGEPIIANRKYKDACRFKPTAKLIFATNTLPRFNDVTLGIWRRMMIVPFEYVVPNDKVDVHLRKRLEVELPGVFLWALQGAARLAEKKRFSTAAVCERGNRNYRLSCFPILTFFEECTEPGGSVATRLLWQTYRDWCHEWGLTRAKPLHSFIKDAIGFYPNIQYPRVHTGQAGDITLAGIQLRPNLCFGVDGRTPPPRAWYNT